MYLIVMSLWKFLEGEAGKKLLAQVEQSKIEAWLIMIQDLVILFNKPIKEY